MNEKFLREHWPEAREKIKAQWEKLDDGDLDLINGDLEVLIGNLQAAYGWTKEEAERELHQFQAIHLAHASG